MHEDFVQDEFLLEGDEIDETGLPKEDEDEEEEAVEPGLDEEAI